MLTAVASIRSTTGLGGHDDEAGGGMEKQHKQRRPRKAPHRQHDRVLCSIGNTRIHCRTSHAMNLSQCHLHLLLDTYKWSLRNVQHLCGFVRASGTMFVSDTTVVR